MKRAAFAFVIAVRASQNFRAEFFRFCAAGEQVAVISMRGEKIVVCPKTRQRRNACGLLADIKVIVAAKHSLIVQRNQAFLEVTDDEHPAAEI